MTHYFFAKPTIALAGSPCFDFSSSKVRQNVSSGCHDKLT